MKPPQRRRNTISNHVLYLNSVPSPYVVGRFAEVSATASANGAAFTAAFEMLKEPGREWTVDSRTWQFAAVNEEISTAFRAARLVWRIRPRVLVTLYHSPVYVAAMIVTRMLGGHVIVRVLRTHESWNRRTAIRTLIKCLIFRFLVDGFEISGNDAARFARSYLGSRSAPMWTTTQTIDRKLFVPAEGASNSTRGVRFLYVGRMVQEKGLDDLISAFATVRSSVAVPVELVLVGGRTDYLAQVEARYGSKGVTHLGHLEGADLRRAYIDSHAFVFPTHGDPYGLVLTEAAACGLALISTSAAGELRERIVESGAGIVVPPGNPRALSEAMIRLANEPLQMSLMRECALASVRASGHDAYAGNFWTMIAEVNARYREH